jgi:sporulation protein YlmC with PRC-barrel domain
MLLLSDLIGSDVRAVDGTVVGHLVDLTVEVGVDALVQRVGVGRRRHTRALVDWEDVVSFEPGDIRLALSEAQVAARWDGPELSERELRLVRDVLDTQIIDVAGKRLARVSEVLLARAEAALQVTAVEVGAAGVWRRLGLRRWAAGMTDQTVDWDDLHLTSARGHALQLAHTGSAVHRLEPAELAAVVAHLPTPRAAEVLDAVSTTAAAGALSAAHPSIGARLLHAVPRRRASSLVSTMPIDDAAAVLRGLPPDALEEVLGPVPAARGARLRHLLAHRTTDDRPRDGTRRHRVRGEDRYGRVRRRLGVRVPHPSRHHDDPAARRP